MVDPDGRAVEHLPEPQQRLALGKEFGIGIGKVLGLQRHVLRVQREREHVSRQLRGKRQIQLAAVRTSQIKLAKLVAHDLGAALRGLVTGELFIEKLNPAAINLFSFGGGMRGVVLCLFHTD